MINSNQNAKEKLQAILNVSLADLAKRKGLNEIKAHVGDFLVVCYISPNKTTSFKIEIELWDFGWFSFHRDETIEEFATATEKTVSAFVENFDLLATRKKHWETE